MFVDPSAPDLVCYAIKKIKPNNLLIINSAVFIGYRNWQDIKQDLDNFKQFVDQIIVTIPLIRLDFNRLKYTNLQIASLLNGVVVDDTVVICR
jgi:hypothetical protein